ncbi:DUF2786 domain-containing protein [Micromonospora sp. NBC_01813]|uniref:DUF2786 domain-containing protein n=1 Tax=Micromonospora sp. NBC_01813 TaxID=2975988 RepID=UPI002DD8AC3A|nr:DUF2786 domain-containing protein [Micromonospora sp. NBC_01813]WSA08842.1 DUF2786 domain-containing protein [Micromonospora sp. NBC_01813]
MGVRNQQRRAAKKKAKEQRQRLRAESTGTAYPGFGGFGAPTEADRVEAVLRLAARAASQDLPDELDDRVAELVTADGQVVDLVLGSAFQQCVTALWQHGWMPADLLRVVRREHGKRAVTLIAGQAETQLRGYAAATVSDRWHSQLREHDIEPWATDRPDQRLTAWAERSKLDRFSALILAVRVLTLMVELPRLELVAPLPGSVRPGAAGPERRRPSAGSDADERQLGRIRALLAKAESTEFPEEAEALSAKAQELMTRYSIDHALLAAADPAGDTAPRPIAVRVGLDAPYEQAKALLLQQVAEANRCRSVWSAKLGFATVVGFAGDCESVELLHTSLLVQATTALVRNGPQRGRGGQSTTRSFRQSFLEAYAVRIGQRLQSVADDAGRQAAERTGAALVPVLAARDEQVQQATERLFPELGGRTISGNNRDGWIAGTAAADQASLGARQPIAN